MYSYWKNFVKSVSNGRNGCFKNQFDNKQSLNNNQCMPRPYNTTLISNHNIQNNNNNNDNNQNQTANPIATEIQKKQIQKQKEFNCLLAEEDVIKQVYFYFLCFKKKIHKKKAV